MVIPALLHPSHVAKFFGLTILATGIGFATHTVVGTRPEQPTHHWFKYEATRACCNDFPDLVRHSTLIVVARVTGTMGSRVIPFDPPVLVQHTQPSLSGWKAQLAASMPTPTPVPEAEAKAASLPGVIVTDSTISVLRVLRGRDAGPGQEIPVTQMGGTAPSGDQVSDPEDPFLQVGNTEVFFLVKDSDGRYSAVGGPQGRFTVTSNGLLQPVDPTDYSYTQAFAQRKVDDIVAALATIN